MTVAEMIKRLQAVEDHSTVVKTASGMAAGAEVTTVTLTSAVSSTPAGEGPRSPNAVPSPGFVELDDA